MSVASFTDTLALGQPLWQVSGKPRVLVTGGSGKLGRWVVVDLVENGYEVINLDRVPCPMSPEGVKFLQIDLTDMGQVMEALSEVDILYKRVDAVVHLAALPAPGQTASSFQFHNNTMGVYNILEACRKLSIKNVVIASSETLIGFPFSPHPPELLPITEETERRPESAYSLSKLVGEVMAEQYARWDPDLKVCSLRFSNVQSPEDYANFPKWQNDFHVRKANVWGYIDARDGGQFVRKCLQSSLRGHNTFLVANEETVMTAPSAELVKAVYPTTRYEPIPGLGPNQTLLSVEKGKKLLGFKPKWVWTEIVKELSAK